MNTDSVIVTCSQCMTKNRIPVARILEHPKCGKCGAFLPTDRMGQPVVVTDQTFDREVMASSLPVLVDCWAPWCGPCRSMGPVMDSLAREYAGRLRVAKLNLDENSGIGSRYRITSVPTLFLVKNGRIVDTLLGALPREQLVRHIRRIL